MVSGEGRPNRWRWRRLAYYYALLVWFGTVAFYFGPNVMLFGKLTWISPADFVHYTETRCVPAVQAIKAYERDHGRLPRYGDDMSPYGFAEGEHWGDVEGGQFSRRGPFNHFITYNLADPSGEWRVEGVFTRGRIPLPPVESLPSSRPTVKPNP